DRRGGAIRTHVAAAHGTHRVAQHTRERGAPPQIAGVPLAQRGHMRRRRLLLALVFAVPLLLAGAALVFALSWWSAPPQYTMPVAGVAPSQVRSTWGAPRPGGRRHRGADISAPKGTAVVSATRGVVLRVGTNL